MAAKDIITEVLDTLGLTPTEFARRLGKDRPQIIFDMLSGKTKGVSRAMAHLIKQAYPAFSETWLRTGEGEMLEQEMPANCFTDKSPQVISKTNMSDCLQIIQDLIKQNAEKDKQLQSLQESYRTLAAAFDALAQKYNCETASKIKKRSRITRLFYINGKYYHI